MRLHAMRFRGVGPFGARGVALDGMDPGLNVVCETNEFGKSTILAALEATFFLPHTSAKQDIRRLSTDGLDAPIEGEIEFEVAGRRYHLAKRFLKGRMAELRADGQVIATAREAEEKLADLLSMSAGEGGPSGLLWVRQGRSMEGVRDDGQVAAKLEGRLEGELGEMVGGERARDYLARVEAELKELVTATGKPRTGGPYKAALDRLAEVEAELADARARRDATREAASELDTVRARITRFDSEGETVSEDEIASVRRELEAATLRASRVAALQSRADLLAATARQAADRLEDHVGRVAAFNRLTGERAEIVTARTELQARVETLSARRAELASEVAALDEQVREIEAKAGARERAGEMRLRHARMQGELERLGGLTDALDQLETERDTASARLDDLPGIAREDAERLRALQSSVREAEARLGAVRVRLRLELDTPGQVTLDGAPVESGPVELVGGAALEIAGVGRVLGDAEAAQGLREERDTARSRLQAELERLGADTIAIAEAVASERAELERTRRRVVGEIARLAPDGGDALRAAFAARAAEMEEVSDTLLTEEAEPVREADGEDPRDALRDRRASLSVVEDELGAAGRELTRLETRMDGLAREAAALRLPDDEAARTAEADALAAAKLSADTQARAGAQALDDARTQGGDADASMLEAKLARLDSVRRNAERELSRLRERAAALEARRNADFEGEDADARVGMLEGRAESLRAEVARHERSVAARTLLRDTLQATQSRLQAAYTAPVRRELEPLLARVIHKGTGSAGAALDESLGATGVVRGGREEPLDQLSGGTREQIAILTRLAYARLLARGGAPAPVILDDALVYADDARRDAMFDVLAHVSTDTEAGPVQVPYLSCHAGATARLGGNRIIPGVWVN